MAGMKGLTGILVFSLAVVSCGGRQQAPEPGAQEPIPVTVAPVVTIDSAEQLEDLVKLVGAERIMAGSDYCFDIAYDEPVRFVQGVKGLSAAQKQQILWDNAARFYKQT